ncbi:glycosyltransferase family 4 protein [Flavobacterium sp. SUN046]|uniref:glycosyltransferase family 4 protein n=1 Tax=Flavobacterium sp. SUN046 TaxID=3002440 RepID=UPI002DB9E8AE|nr:glycosyltransferase family 4 protein [Flavobacterium sp. SUN046]MEC4049937.1 glycosyltransferase family 4 protein [Flavobacterium sp. SUN046]
MGDNNKNSVFCPMITPTDNGGGVKSTIALMNGLQALGHQVTVVVPKNCAYLSKLDPEITVLFFEIDPLISLFRPLRYIKLCKWIFNHFKKAKNNTVYFCSDRPALMLALFVPKTATILYVSRGWFYTNWSARFLRMFLFPKVSAFVGISEKQYCLMKNYAKPNAKVYRIENGLSMTLKSFIPFQNSTINIATIGGICKRKNQWQAIGLIQLMKDLYPVKLIIFGAPVTAEDKRYMAMLQRIITQNRLDEYIEIKGYESNFDIIYGQSDIVISTATEEGFGRTLIEAMSYGIPVIASDKAGGPSTIINHLSDGLLYDGSLNDLLAKTSLLIGDKVLRKEIINKALEKVRSNYTEQIMCEKYSNIIEYGTKKN